MVAACQHLEGKARNLGDDVINAWLETAGARRSRRFTVRIYRERLKFFNVSLQSVSEAA